MTDVTLLVMEANNPVADTPARWRQGEIVDVFPRNVLLGDRAIMGPAGHPRHLHVHVTGIPASFEKIHAALTREHLDDDADPGSARARRRFVIDASLIPLATRQALLLNREITVTWDQAKSYAKRRKAQSLELNSSLTDADVA